MSGSHHRGQRAAPATRLDRLSRLLSWGQNASLPRERRTDATTHPRANGRSRRGVRGSWWTAPSVRASRSLTRVAFRKGAGALTGEISTHSRTCTLTPAGRRIVAAHRAGNRILTSPVREAAHVTQNDAGSL